MPEVTNFLKEQHWAYLGGEELVTQFSHLYWMHLLLKGYFLNLLLSVSYCKMENNNNQQPGTKWHLKLLYFFIMVWVCNGNIYCSLDWNKILLHRLSNHLKVKVTSCTKKFSPHTLKIFHCGNIVDNLKSFWCWRWSCRCSCKHCN